MRRRAPRPAVVTLAVVLLGGCAAPGETDGSTADPQLTAAAFRLREDEAVGGRFQVKVANVGAVPVEIVAVRLEGEALPAGAATPRATELAPGRRVDLPVTHGPARCPADPSDVVAVLEVEVDGEPGTVVLPLGHDPGSRATLRRVIDESCAAQRIAQVVAATLEVEQPQADDGGLTLPAAVVLTRVGTESPPIEVTAVGGSVLYGMAAREDALPARLAPPSDEARVPVLIRSTRCTGHEVGEAKKPYDLGVWLRVDGGDETWSRVRTSPAVQAELRDYLRAACGLG